RGMAHKSGEAWSYLGPGNVGGRTRALVIDPLRPRTMYAGGVDGGVWKTTDGGASWLPLGDLLPSLAVASLALDPSHRGVLYAGTGEGFGNGDAVRGAGIFKSSDGGATWHQLLATATSDFTYVNRLAVSPHDGARVYAATGTGLFRSLDAGAHWTRILDPATAAGCLDLAIAPVNATPGADDLLFVSCGNLEPATVYRTVRANKAARFQAVLREDGMGRTSLAIAPSRPSVVYALAASNLGGPSGRFQQGLHALYRSAATGAPGSFVARVRNTDPTGVASALLSSTRFAFQHDCGAAAGDLWSGRGWYDNVLAVDPTDPDRVWAGGVDLFRSDDGGRSWGIASYWWAAEAGVTSGFAHADQHAIVFHPRYDGRTNRMLFVAGDGGVYRTADALAPVASGADAPCHPGSSAFVWTSLNHGYGVTQFYHGLPFPDGRSYLGGTQDNGVLAGSDAAGAEGWRNVLGSDGGQVAIDAGDPRLVYAEAFRLSLSRSTDGGATFTPSTIGLSGTFGLLAPLLADPTVPRRVWIGGSTVFRSDDAGASFSAVSPLLAGNAIDTLTALAVSPPDAPGPPRLLAGTTSGEIFWNDGSAAGVVADGRGVPWVRTLPRDGYVSSLAFAPGSSRVAYATYSTFGGTHVFQSLDGGASWQGIDGRTPAGALPDLPVHTLAVDPRNPQRLYVGTDLGIFLSEDGGGSWAVEDAGFAGVVTESLAVGRLPDGRPALYAFTHGRGAWRMALPE